MITGAQQEPMPLKTLMMVLKSIFDDINTLRIEGEQAELCVDIKKRVTQLNHSIAIQAMREEQAQKEASQRADEEEKTRQALATQVAQLNGADGPHTDSH